jgi:hypothetical protein
LGKKNDNNDEVPIPARASEMSKLRNPLSEGMAISDFFFAVLPAEQTVTKWTAYANEERTAYFLKLEALGVVHGDKVNGKLCPVIETREVKAVLAIFLIMGVAHVKNIADAYRQDENLRNEGIANIMSLARLKQVSNVGAHLHDFQAACPRGVSSIRSIYTRVHLLAPH